MTEDSGPISQRRWMPWAVLGAYWPLLFVCTHLSPLRLAQLQVRGRDVFLHWLAYLVLTLLFWWARYGRQRPHLRAARTYLTLLFIAGYGVLDELSQLVVQRDASVSDWLSDVAGCLTALALLMVLRSYLHWLLAYWLAWALLTHWSGRGKLFQILPAYIAEFQVAFRTVGYVVLTLLWLAALRSGRSAPLDRAPVVLTLLVLLAYALVDQLLRVWAAGGFDLPELAGSAAGVLLGLGAAHLWSRQHHVPD